MFCKLSPPEAVLKGGWGANQTALAKEHSKKRWKSISGKPHNLQEPSILLLKDEARWPVAKAFLSSLQVKALI